MWPFKRGDGTEDQPRESELARRAAERGLRQSIEDRHEVQEVTRIVHIELAENHISQRIKSLLEGRLRE